MFLGFTGMFRLEERVHGVGNMAIVSILTTHITLIRGVLASRGIKRDKLNGTNGAEFAVFRRFSLIFADFLFLLGIIAFRRCRFSQKAAGETADFSRKPQETAEFCRKPFVPFSLSLLIPPYCSPSSLRRWDQKTL